jgi:GWxTD domain-containing protein
MSSLRPAVASVLTALFVRQAATQNASRLVAQAESLSTLGEASRAFALAVQATTQEPSSARAWLARGIAASAQRPFPLARFGVVSVAFNDWQREAVQSLTRATRLSPDSGRYWVELGIVQSLSTDSTFRRMAMESLGKGRDLATAAHDGPVVSQANEAIGWWYWRRFERQLVYLPTSPEAHNELRSATLGDSAKRDSLNNFLEWGQGWQGDYLDATEHFERAVFADSANERARHNVLRSLVTFERWDELLAVAQQQVRDVNWDAWPWLALGLAQHRLGRRSAAAAFDSAIVRLTMQESAYFLDLSRLLAPDAASAYRAQVPALRSDADRFYWLHSDPLWLEAGNLRWVECLSRLTFAELRWGTPELGLRGLDTDPGRVYVRFGPPSRIVGADTSRLGVPHVTWTYNASVRFRFVTQPLLGAVQLDPESEAMLRENAAVTPVSWPPAADDGYTVRDIAIQSAAFFPRPADAAAPDSLSVVVIAPNARAGASEAALFLADRGGHAERMPTTPAPIVADDTAWMGYEAHAPGVSAYVRFEVRDTARHTAVRAAAELAPLAEHSPQVSDIIVARCMANKPRLPARWFDARIRFTPSAGCDSDRLLVLWEEGVLENGIDGGTARITVRSGAEDDVETMLRMASDPRPPSIELRALGSSEARAEGIAQRGNREVSLSIPLAAVHARATLRYVELSLKAIKRSKFIVTLDRSLPGGIVVRRARSVPWN